jgi:hypothetical protein
MIVIPALRRLRQEDHEFSLGYIMRDPDSKTRQKKKENKVLENKTRLIFRIYFTREPNLS